MFLGAVCSDGGVEDMITDYTVGSLPYLLKPVLKQVFLVQATPLLHSAPYSFWRLTTHLLEGFSLIQTLIKKLADQLLKNILGVTTLASLHCEAPGMGGAAPPLGLDLEAGAAGSHTYRGPRIPTPFSALFCTGLSLFGPG